jgi:hypothetical protein
LTKGKRPSSVGIIATSQGDRIKQIGRRYYLALVVPFSTVSDFALAGGFFLCRLRSGGFEPLRSSLKGLKLKD